MKTYKKRAKEGWETGKGAKKNSNRQERQYEKQEVREELAEYEEGEDFKYKRKSQKIFKGNKKLIHSLETKIARIEKWLRRLNLYENSSCWIGNRIESGKQELKKLKKELRIGSQQAKEGKGKTSEELKKDLTNPKKRDIIQKDK